MNNEDMETGVLTSAPASETVPLTVGADQRLRRLSRSPRPSQLASFLATCRAHPTPAAALDYATKKHEEAVRDEQRLEEQYWSEVRELLQRWEETEAQDRPHRSTEAAELARHLLAESLYRSALAEEGAHQGGRGAAGPGRSSGHGDRR